ncbi:2173_t:CDS:1, partial [Acaulospora colombiana]
NNEQLPIANPSVPNSPVYANYSSAYSPPPSWTSNPVTGTPANPVTDVNQYRPSA